MRRLAHYYARDDGDADFNYDDDDSVWLLLRLQLVVAVVGVVHCVAAEVAGHLASISLVEFTKLLAVLRIRENRLPISSRLSGPRAEEPLENRLNLLSSDEQHAHGEKHSEQNHFSLWPTLLFSI